MTIATKVRKATDYAKLAGLLPPRIIRTNDEAQAAYEVVESLMGLEDPTDDQREFLDFQARLLQEYESKTHPTPALPLPKLLAQLLDFRGITKAELARQTGISPSIVSEMLTGRRSVSVQNIAKFSNFFGVSPAVFVEAAQLPSRDKLAQRKVGRPKTA